MNPLTEQQVIHVCYAIITGMFADMCNPNNRGENFNWQSFPEKQAKRCKTELSLYIPPEAFEKEEYEQMREMAERAGIEIAQKMVERAGFI